MADVATASPEVDVTAQKTKPVKPDKAKYEADLAAAEEKHAANMQKFNAAKARLESARSGKAPPDSERWNALVDKQKSITEQQRQKKSSRDALVEKYHVAQAQLKTMLAEKEANRGRMSYKSEAEVDAKIADLRRQVDSGTMRIVDEKKALDEIGRLTRLKRTFGGLEELQNKIDAKKADNAELKKALDDPDARALNEQYDAIKAELDQMNAARDDDRKNMRALKEEKERLNQEQQGSYRKIREIRDAYSKGHRAFKAYEDQQHQQRRDRQKAERKALEEKRRKEVAARELEEASRPAYMDEILTAEGLLRYFDPSSAPSESAKGPSKLAASAQRTVDDSAMQGMKVLKKEEEDFFVGGGGKKKGKGKKTAAAEGTKFNMSIGIIEELGKIGVEPPSNQSDIPAVLEKLKAKLEGWRTDQDNQTKKNIEKAKKEIDRLEREADEAAASTSPRLKSGGGRRDAGRKTTSLNQGVDGEISAEAELDQERDAAADVTAEMQEAQIEDKDNDAVVEAQS